MSRVRDLLKEYNISTTAVLANYWKTEAKSKKNWPAICQQPGGRERDLFKDSLMGHFFDAEAKQDAVERLDPRMWLSLASRTRFFRRTVSHAVKHKAVKQVIILGSGFDTLPARKIKYTNELGVTFFEIDQSHLLACKQAIYAENHVDKNADYIGIDYVKENLIEQLKMHAVDFTVPTLILWEGNTFYLDKTDVINIYRT